MAKKVTSISYFRDAALFPAKQSLGVFCACYYLYLRTFVTLRDSDRFRASLFPTVSPLLSPTSCGIFPPYFPFENPGLNALQRQFLRAGRHCNPSPDQEHDETPSNSDMQKRCAFIAQQVTVALSLSIQFSNLPLHCLRPHRRRAIWRRRIINSTCLTFIHLLPSNLRHLDILSYIS